jgi:hypothetical protein
VFNDKIRCNTTFNSILTLNPGGVPIESIQGTKSRDTPFDSSNSSITSTNGGLESVWCFKVFYCYIGATSSVEGPVSIRDIQDVIAVRVCYSLIYFLLFLFLVCIFSE